jgi:hypothetical protein
MTEVRPYAVLFDLDGTLIDSIALLLASMKHTFQGRSRQPTDAEWIEGLGTPLPKQLTPYVESDEDRERLVNRCRTFQNENHDQLMAHYEGVIDTRPLTSAAIPGCRHQQKHDDGARPQVHRRRRLHRVAIGYDSVHTQARSISRPALKSSNTRQLKPSSSAIRPRHQVGQCRGVIIAALWGPFTRSQLES